MGIFKKLSIAVFCIFAAMALAGAASAQEAETARDITDTTILEGENYSQLAMLTDGNAEIFHPSEGDCLLRLENPEGIGGLYLLFDLEYGPYQIVDPAGKQVYTAGTQNFLHEYIDLTEAFGYAPQTLCLLFRSGTVALSEIYCFSQGTPPQFVQRWQPPLEGRTDILLFAAHGDDDQLYFAGLFPLYAGQLACNVQVAYMTDHRNLTKERTHEMLNGLWDTGVTAYPVFGRFPDFRIDSLNQTYRYYGQLGYSREDLMGFVVEQLRRFKPMVAVGHDFMGEYGHGMHRVYADLLAKALTIAADQTQYPALAEKYGTWDTPKAYFHLYEKDPIVIDYDTPLDHFDGLTAFQVTQHYGFPCHKTQQYDSFVNWLYGKYTPITKATQILKYNPAKFGLYRSTVGEDIAKNDFLENIETYSQQERAEAQRLEQERLEQERAEQERLEKERLEQERLEQERLEQERLEQERLEQERLEQERLEQERLEQERLEQERLALRRRIALASLLFLGVVVLLAALHLRKKSAGKT